MIPRPIIDQVTETANAHIVDVVGAYVSLKKRGANYMGCCPFHTEKTPSFSVSPAKGYCYCFGCHKGGNAVNFIMELEKMNYPDAIRYLGQRFGIDVPEETISPELLAASKKKDALYAIVEYAARHFETNLRETDEGQVDGLGYFRSRGFRDDTIATFRLGYAMRSRQALLTQALKDGYKEEFLVDAGLISTGDNGYRKDKFAERVIFPIQNTSGKVIGFGGRVLDARTKGVQLKYLNSPETELYIKSDIVYGIYQARTDISRADKCYLVEGYTDVISMHQNGIKNVVASSGTALTPNQIRLIKRFTSNITVLYDGDSAGIHAALRGIDLILHEGMNARVLLLPDGDDPDSFARKHTEEEFQAYVAEHETDIIRFQAERLMAEAAGDPIRRAETTHTMVNTIAEVQDRIKREVYVKECSRIMGVSEETLFDALQKRMTANAIRQRDRDVAEQRLQNLRQQNGGQLPTPSVVMQQAQQGTAHRQNASGGLPANNAANNAANTAVNTAADLPSDLTPSELALLQGQGFATAATGQNPSTYTPSSTSSSSLSSKAATPYAGVLSSAVNDVEFAEVMRFFVTYNQVPMRRVEGQPTVAQYICEAVECDNLVPSNPVFARILDAYRAQEDKSRVDVNFFMNQPDADICAYVAQAVGGRQELSHIHSKYTTIVDEVDMVDELVERAVNELRFKELLKTIDDVMAQMNTLCAQGAPDEELDAVMQRLVDLNQIKKALAAEMGDRSIIR